MVDLFEQVEEELRVEQYKRLAARFLPWVLALVIGIVVLGGGYIAWHKWRESSSAQSAEKFDAAMKALSTGDQEAAFKAFGEVVTKGGAYKSMALMHQAAIRLQEGKTKEAVALFDQTAEAAPRGVEGELIGDAARLKSALALMDDAPYAEIEARLKPLTEEKRPYRMQALEALAMARLSAGKTKEARADFLVLSAALDAPPGIADRARAALGLIDAGSVASVGAAVKAAKTLPPPAPQIPADLLQQLQAQGVQVPGAPAQ